MYHPNEHLKCLSKSFPMSNKKTRKTQIMSLETGLFLRKADDDDFPCLYDNKVEKSGIYLLCVISMLHRRALFSDTLQFYKVYVQLANEIYWDISSIKKPPQIEIKNRLFLEKRVYDYTSS